ncbi:MAG: sensor histidine kinase, partial [Epsilonproteobacteria bacterium]|nr:sensor histidine kinase [Campylobacterota bacterium]
MQKHAVLITVLFALFVTLISVSAVFWEFYKLNKSQYIDNIFSKHETIIQIYREHLQKHTSQIMLEANLAIYKFVIEKDKNTKQNITKNAKQLKNKIFKRVDEAIMLNKKGLYTQRVV